MSAKRMNRRGLFKGIAAVAGAGIVGVTAEAVAAPVESDEDRYWRIMRARYQEFFDACTWDPLPNPWTSTKPPGYPFFDELLGSKT